MFDRSRRERGRDEPATGARYELVWIALALLALLGVFFEKPLRSFSDQHYTSADLSQDYALTRIEAGYSLANEELHDPAMLFQPWALRARASIENGRFPLWNEANGCGAPFLGNASSAVLSPFTLPFYVLPFRAALIAAPFAKLLLIGLFGFLFLRRLSLSIGAAAFGAIAFTWSGQAVLGLAYPDTAALAALPAALFFADVACARLGERERGPVGALGLGGALLGLVLSLFVGLVGGRPIAFWSCVLTVTSWCAFRLFETWRASSGEIRPSAGSMSPSAGAMSPSGGPRRAPRSRHGVLAVSALVLATAGALAAGLAAVQLLPFLEYVKHSAAFAARAAPGAGGVPMLGGGVPDLASTWPYLFFPNLLGNPAKTDLGWPAGPAQGFAAVNSIGTSALVVFLALISIAWIRRSRAHGVFALLLAWWIARAFDLGGVARIVDSIAPDFGTTSRTRGEPVGVFALCVCAAFAVERIGALARATDRRRARWTTSATVLALAALCAWPMYAGAHAKLDAYVARNAAPESFVAYSRSHAQFMLLLFGAGAAVVASLPWLRFRALRAGAGIALVLFAFLPWGWMNRNYDTTVPDRFVYPRTESIDRLRQFVHEERVLLLARDAIPPEMNLAYGLVLPTNDDGLSIREFDAVWRRHFDPTAGPRRATMATAAGLDMLGIRRIVTQGTWLPIETTFAGVEWDERERFRAGPIAPGSEITQTFTASADGLQAVRIEVATDNRANRCTLWFALEDAESGATIDVQSMDASNLRQGTDGRCELVFRFDPLPRSKGHRYALTLSSPDATSSQCLTALATHEFGKTEEYALTKRPHAPLTEYIPGRLRAGGETLQGGLTLDLSYNRELFRRVTEFGGFTLWMFEAGVEPYHFVEHARPAANGAEALEIVSAPGFDGSREVVLGAEDIHLEPMPARALAQTEMRTDIDESTRARVVLRNSVPGWLVVARPRYPGWIARVNGVEKPLLRANHAFCAVELGAGANEVELEYRPTSFRRGVWITAASALGLLLLLTLLRRRAAR